MNKKRTNLIISIFNIICIATFIIFAFSSDYIKLSIMSGDTGYKSIFNSFIIDTLVNNIMIIFTVVYSGVSILNIICAIQNRQNKKMCFWQLIFGICFLAYIIIAIIDDYTFEWISRIVFSIIPIILAIINLILAKKHKSKVIQIISYIAVIVLSIFNFLEIITLYWNIIAIVMQLIYIHFQDKNIEESKSRVIVNIILYYIIQPLLVIILLGMILYSILITKVNNTKWKNELTQLYDGLSSMQGVTNSEICVPVEKGYKYGFINENGKEIIPCEYDRVSYFNEMQFNNNTYYLALALKDNKYYIISKSNESIIIDSILEKYLQDIYGNWSDRFTKDVKEIEQYRLSYIYAYDYLFSVLSSPLKMTLCPQSMQPTNEPIKLSLTEENSKYYYNNENYSMAIEPVYDGSEEEENYYNNYNGNTYYYNEDENSYNTSSYEAKYNVIISKPNEKPQSSIVRLPGIDTKDCTLTTYTNGYIAFSTEDKNGWYDLNGNQSSIPNKYEINDIRDDKIILKLLNTDTNETYNENTKHEMDFTILNLNGKKLLHTTALDVYDNSYLVKNENNKMVLLDKDLNVISDEYDKIISTMQMDISANYCSYY